MSIIMDKCEVGVFNYYYSKIDIYTIINYLKVYAELKQYKLDKNVQIVICSLHNNNNYISISDEDKEKAKTGNLFVKVKDTRFNICSDFDYNKDPHDRKQYINLYENFAINMEHRNHRGVFSVYFKNIPDSKKSNGYLNRIHMLKRESIDNFPKAITSDYIIPLIQEVIQNNKNIVSSNSIDIYLPHLEYSLYMFNKNNLEIDHSIADGICYIIDDVTYVFHDNFSDPLYYPISNISEQKLNKLEKDYNSIHVEFMRYSAVNDPIWVFGFYLFFR